MRSRMVQWLRVGVLLKPLAGHRATRRQNVLETPIKSRAIYHSAHKFRGNNDKRLFLQVHFMRTSSSRQGIRVLRWDTMRDNPPKGGETTSREQKNNNNSCSPLYKYYCRLLHVSPIASHTRSGTPQHARTGCPFTAVECWLPSRPQSGRTSCRRGRPASRTA